MFTGLVAAIGAVRKISRKGGDLRLSIATPFKPDALLPGGSMAVNGVCLTADEVFSTEGRLVFSVYVSEETLAVSNLRFLSPGREVNLEPALNLGQPLGGHIVSGHVDGAAVVSELELRSRSHFVKFSCDPALDVYIVDKGSVCVDGISLTVNRCGPGYFELNIIPETWNATTARNWQKGYAANLEVDLLGKYVAKMLRISDLQSAGRYSDDVRREKSNRSGLGLDFFINNGFN